MVSIMLSQRLAERRMTQADLARMTGIRPTTINEMYHEISERVNLEHIDLICEALNCDVCDLLTVHYNAVARAEQLARRKASQYLSHERVAGAPRGYGRPRY